jgi:hypothetical protein
MSIDEFFHKCYNRQSYNCAHFVCDVWKRVTGASIDRTLEGFLHPPSARRADPALRRAFVRLGQPVNPCIVLMQRAKSAPHVGVYLNGRVLHIHEHGVEFQPVDVASRGFDRVRFYK